RDRRPHQDRRGARERPPRAVRAHAAAPSGAAERNAMSVATANGERQTAHAYDVARVRADFPILATRARGKKLVYLDNAATTQKPNAVIDRIVRYYREENSNVHRGVHYLSEVATAAYESARTTVKLTPNARDEKEIVFTRGTTEAINLGASSWGGSNRGAGAAVPIS